MNNGRINQIRGAALRTSLRSLAKGYVLTHQTEGSSSHTVKYYRGHSIVSYGMLRGSDGQMIPSFLPNARLQRRGYGILSIGVHLLFTLRLLYAGTGSLFAHTSRQGSCIAIPEVQQVVWLAIAIILRADIVKVVKEYPYILFPYSQ